MAKRSKRDTYQGPNQGFRGRVTRAAWRLLADRVKGSTDPTCPGCWASLPDTSVEALRQHAEDCTWLRADVAETPSLW